MGGPRASHRPVVVLLHGWAGSLSDWADLWPYLVAGHEQVIAYDAAGFGRSQFGRPEEARQASFSIERYTADLEALLDQEGVERVRLVGHSWGGVVAISFAARYPERVESLVVIGSAYFDPHRLLHLAFKWVSYVIAWVLVLLKGPLRRSARLQRGAIRRYFHRQPDPASATRLIEAVLASDNRAIIQTLLEGYKVRFKQVCPALKSPTLYLGCDKDVVAPLGFVRPFVALTPGGQYSVIAGCGHFPMIEQPAQLHSRLQSFWQPAP